VFWGLVACNILAPQALWLKRVRTQPKWLFWVSMIVLLGMWLERCMIVITSLHRDFLPSAWGMYTPTFWDWATFIGTLGLFTWLLFLFVRFLPMISMFEMRTLVHEEE
jgi:molybdopterin-containing oxidoreductase family membrane subunit